eukprot:6454736-Amphidinium_carterae.1
MMYLPDIVVKECASRKLEQDQLPECQCGNNLLALVVRVCWRGPLEEGLAPQCIIHQVSHSGGNQFFA